MAVSAKAAKAAFLSMQIFPDCPGCNDDYCDCASGTFGITSLINGARCCRLSTDERMQSVWRLLAADKDRIMSFWNGFFVALNDLSSIEELEHELKFGLDEELDKVELAISVLRSYCEDWLPRHRPTPSYYTKIATLDNGVFLGITRDRKGNLLHREGMLPPPLKDIIEETEWLAPLKDIIDIPGSDSEALFATEREIAEHFLPLLDKLWDVAHANVGRRSAFIREVIPRSRKRAIRFLIRTQLPRMFVHQMLNAFGRPCYQEVADTINVYFRLRKPTLNSDSVRMAYVRNNPFKNRTIRTQTSA